MSFKQSRHDNFYSVFLNTDQFAETVTYRRPGTADQRIACVVQDAPEDLAEQRLEELREQRIKVRIGRDNTMPQGGIDEPHIGDTIVRDCFPNWIYSFQGVVRETTPHSFTLEFARKIPTRVGR